MKKVLEIHNYATNNVVKNACVMDNAANYSCNEEDE